MGITGLPNFCAALLQTASMSSPIMAGTHVWYTKIAGGLYFSMISLIDLNKCFSPPNTMSCSSMSVVKLVRNRFDPELLAPRLSQELPSQAIGPCTRWATSVIGCSAILAPSKAQPPAAPPGCSCLVQPFLRSFSPLPWFLPQPGSSKTSLILADSDVIEPSCNASGAGGRAFGRRRPASANDVEAVVGLRRHVGVAVDDVEDLVEDRHQHVQPALIAPNRIAVVVVAVEDREADADQRRTGVALEELAVGVADQEVHRIGEQQRAHVPQILAGVDVAIRAERRRCEQRTRLLLPRAPAIGRQDVRGLGTQLQQEAGEAQGQIGVAVERELLAVDMRVGIGDRVHQPAALALDRVRHRLAGQARNFLHEAVGRRDADRVVEGDRLLPPGADIGERLLGAEFLHRDRRLRVHRGGRLRERGAAVIHAELAVGRRVEHVAGVAEQRVLGAEQVEQTSDFALVADRVAVESADDVERLVGHTLLFRYSSSLAAPEMLYNALQ